MPPEGESASRDPRLAPLLAVVERLLRDEPDVLVCYPPEPLLIARGGYERYVDSKLAPEDRLERQIGPGLEAAWDALTAIREVHLLAEDDGVGSHPFGGWEYALEAVDLEGRCRLYVEERAGDFPQPGIFFLAVTANRGERADDEVRARWLSDLEDDYEDEYEDDEDDDEDDYEDEYEDDD